MLCLQAMSFSGLTGGCTISSLFQEEYVQCCNLLRLFLCFILNSNGIATERDQDVLLPKKGPLNLNHLLLQLDEVEDPRFFFSSQGKISLQREKKKSVQILQQLTVKTR